jgi:hypothetical protein
VRIARLAQSVVRPCPVVATLFLLYVQIVPLVRPAAAQGAAAVEALPFKPTFRHHQRITSVYAADRDTTTVSVVLDKGKYFLWTQRPRVTVAYQYAGTTAPEGRAADWMLVELRTQAPQAATTNRLRITSVGEEGGGDTVRVEAVASASRLEAHAFTNDHRMTFVVRPDDAAKFLAARRVGLEVGGVVVRLKEEQMEAWREVAWRMGGWGR